MNAILYSFFEKELKIKPAEKEYIDVFGFFFFIHKKRGYTTKHPKKRKLDYMNITYYISLFLYPIDVTQKFIYIHCENDGRYSSVGYNAQECTVLCICSDVSKVMFLKNVVKARIRNLEKGGLDDFFLGASSNMEGEGIKKGFKQMRNWVYYPKFCCGEYKKVNEDCGMRYHPRTQVNDRDGKIHAAYMEEFQDWITECIVQMSQFLNCFGHSKGSLGKAVSSFSTWIRACGKSAERSKFCNR